MSDKHHPKKRFGQNFLIDETIIQRIINSIQAKESDALIEIGPGFGALTHKLLATCPALTIIEIDNDLAKFWLGQQKTHTQLMLQHQDVLEVDFKALALKSAKPLRIVGNLPYNISSPLLFHLFSFDDLISDMCFMLQKEVVDRLCAEPNSKTYGRLSIMAQYYCDIHKLFEVPNTAFKPAPNVTSAICRLIPKKASERYPVDPKKLAECVRLAFTMRRKTLPNALKGLLTLEQIKSPDINPQLRPENLSLEDFCRLANLSADPDELSLKTTL